MDEIRRQRLKLVTLGIEDSDIKHKFLEYIFKSAKQRSHVRDPFFLDSNSMTDTLINFAYTSKHAHSILNLFVPLPVVDISLF